MSYKFGIIFINLMKKLSIYLSSSNFHITRKTIKIKILETTFFDLIDCFLCFLSNGLCIWTMDYELYGLWTVYVFSH